MKKYVLIGLMLLLFTPNSDAADDITQADLNNLQGKWNIVRVEQEGKDIRQRIGYSQIIVDGNTTLVTSRGKALKSRFIIDPTKTPKQITFITYKGDEVRGIYELNGDIWRQLQARPDKERPKNINDAGLYYELKRTKLK